MFLNLLKANNIMINIFADLKLSMKKMRFHTMSTAPNSAIDAKHVFLVLSVFLMQTTRIKELAMEKSAEPICVLYIKFATYLRHYRTSKTTSLIIQFNNWVIAVIRSQIDKKKKEYRQLKSNYCFLKSVPINKNRHLRF